MVYKNIQTFGQNGPKGKGYVQLELIFNLYLSKNKILIEYCILLEIEK
jgi:hypothetical protein